MISYFKSSLFFMKHLTLFITFNDESIAAVYGLARCIIFMQEQKESGNRFIGIAKTYLVLFFWKCFFVENQQESDSNADGGIC